MCATPHSPQRFPTGHHDTICIEREREVSDGKIDDIDVLPLLDHRDSVVVIWRSGCRLVGDIYYSTDIKTKSDER